jgi:hypothetical protein
MAEVQQQQQQHSQQTQAWLQRWLHWLCQRVYEDFRTFLMSIAAFSAVKAARMCICRAAGSEHKLS